MLEKYRTGYNQWLLYILADFDVLLSWLVLNNANSLCRSIYRSRFLRSTQKIRNDPINITDCLSEKFSSKDFFLHFYEFYIRTIIILFDDILK